VDPALRELLRLAPADRTIEAIVRFRGARMPLPGVRIVADFGSVATCRLKVSDIPRVWADPSVASLKASRRLGPEPCEPEAAEPEARDYEAARGRTASQQTDVMLWPSGAALPRRPPNLSADGSEVVLGVIDWGLDVTHPNVRRADGSTRVLALWDQRDHPLSDEPSPEPYGYGVVHSTAAIDQALATPEPFEVLGLHPADADRAGNGAHGMHVTDIAAGRGAVGPAGVAPKAHLIFVYLADRDTGGMSTLGDSVRLLEGVHFVAAAAGDRPWVINLSMGRTGGPKDGTSAVECALDHLIAAGPGRFIVQSAGNYHMARTHAQATVRPGRSGRLRFTIDPRDVTPNELELWYAGSDELVLRLHPPGLAAGPELPLGADRPVLAGEDVVGWAYHRAYNPGNHDHHVDVFLSPQAPSGLWTVEMVGVRSARPGGTVVHGWLERDDSCLHCQPRFVPQDAVRSTTLGTIATGHLPLVVASYDARQADRPPAATSSAGPTRDGRGHPHIAAPGRAVIAARSAPRSCRSNPGLLVAKSGTSMATPHVAGAVALALQLDPTLDARRIRQLLLETAQPPPPGLHDRLGQGYLDIAALIEAVQTRSPDPVDTSHPAEREATTMSAWSEDDPVITAPASAEPLWQNTPAQLEFRDRVLAAHLAATRARVGEPKRDLRQEELADVPGTCRERKGRNVCVRTAIATAEAAGRLLAAANADLARAQQGGDPDALRTLRVSATSGYRDSDTQRRLWLGYFATKYYNRTRAARAALPEGPQSTDAIRYMLRRKADGGYGLTGRIAAPGYSNHQGGTAIDFSQERTAGHAIPNDSDDASRNRWRRSWFHGWLREHAAEHHFQPIPTEEWHWEFAEGRASTSSSAPAATRRTGPMLGPAAPGSAAEEYLGGWLWTFTSTALLHPVAVFCPRAALRAPDVEVLLFAHGLLSGCPRPKRLPQGLVTDEPFRLGHVVDASARPMVLVVPLLDWADTGGASAFGAAHPRWHPFGHPAVLNSLLAQVLIEVGRVRESAVPGLSELTVAGHSRAYDVLEPLVAHRHDDAARHGAMTRLRRIWALDTTYAGDVEAWVDWVRADPDLRVHVFYRPVKGTLAVGERFAARRSNRLHVTEASEGHCAVPATRLAQLLAPSGGGAASDADADLDRDLSELADLSGGA